MDVQDDEREPLPEPLEEPAEEPDDRRSYGVLATALLIIVVIIVLLLLWRSCDSGKGGESDSGGGGSIVDVPGYEAVEYSVAVWVKKGEDLTDVLERHRLGDADVTSFGDGSYVLSYKGPDPKVLVPELKKDPALVDAGYVFSREGSAGP